MMGDDVEKADPGPHGAVVFMVMVMVMVGMDLPSWSHGNSSLEL